MFLYSNREISLNQQNFTHTFKLFVLNFIPFHYILSDSARHTYPYKLSLRNNTRQADHLVIERFQFVEAQLGYILAFPTLTTSATHQKYFYTRHMTTKKCSKACYIRYSYWWLKMVEMFCHDPGQVQTLVGPNLGRCTIPLSKLNLDCITANICY